MQDFIDLLLNYWKPIVGLIFFVISLVIAIVRKKPVTSILDDIYQYAILAINDCEIYSMVDPNVRGEEKLEYAINFVLKLLTSKYPTLDTKKYIGSIKNIIESILTTPQKKGE